jgi:hypothetical protein
VPAGLGGEVIPAEPVITIRILSSDDQPLVRADVAQLIAARPDENVVGEAVGGQPGGRVLTRRRGMASGSRDGPDRGHQARGRPGT